jgi:DNA-directed RNA polymerase specialized sigma24 family protein
VDEAAKIIGVARNTVKTRAFYARQRLAELLSAQGVTAFA